MPSSLPLTSIRFPVELKRWLKIYAATNGTNVNVEVVKAVNEARERVQQQEEKRAHKRTA